MRINNSIFDRDFAEGIIRAVYAGDVLSVALDPATLTPSDRRSLIFSTKHMAFTWTSEPGEYEIMSGNIIIGWDKTKGPRKA